MTRQTRSLRNKRRPDYWASMSQTPMAYGEHHTPSNDKGIVSAWRAQIEFNEQVSLALLEDADVFAKHDARQKAIENMKKDQEIRDHWDAVANMGCIISNQPAEVAHCHGGTISLVLGPQFRPGMGEKQNHWLVIPLNPALHRGRFGLDTGKGGVVAWELEYGSQLQYLEEVSHRLGYDIFEKAGVVGYIYSYFPRPSTAK